MQAALVDWHARLVQALAGTSDSRAALGAVCEEVRALVECDRVQVWRGDLRQMTVQILIATGYAAADGARLAALAVPMTGMPLGPDFLEQKVLILDDVRHVDGYGRALFTDFGLEAVMFLVLERAERVLGALQLSWTRVGAPLPSRPAMDVVRAYVGLAVDMHARTDEAVKTAETLSATAMLLSGIHDPDECLHAMAGRIAAAVGCDWGVVHLLDPQAGVFRYAAGAGPDDVLAVFRHAEGPRALVEESFATAEDGVIELPDVAGLPTHPDYCRGRPIASYMSVPLRRGPELIGSLTLGYCTRVGRFARRPIALAKGLAHHALAALENARLVRSLQQVSQVKTDFVAAVSHDLRTPLHILIGYGDMLLDGAADPLTPSQSELVGRIRDCAVRFLGLINGILEVARLDAGQNAVKLGPVDMEALCDGLAAELDGQRPPAVTLAFEAHAEPVVSDATKLTMILRNLAANALKFTTAGTVTVQCVPAADGGLVLRVRDTGPGISPDDRARIFDMFQQGDAGRRAGGSGLGLGLYLVKRATELMGGTVRLASGEPGATTFEVVLPPPRRVAA